MGCRHFAGCLSAHPRHRLPRRRCLALRRRQHWSAWVCTRAHARALARANISSQARPRARTHASGSSALATRPRIDSQLPPCARTRSRTPLCARGRDGVAVALGGNSRSQHGPTYLRSPPTPVRARPAGQMPITHARECARSPTHRRGHGRVGWSWSSQGLGVSQLKQTQPVCSVACLESDPFQPHNTGMCAG